MENKPKYSDTFPYLTLILLGFCTLCSWNTILSIMDFFEHYVSQVE